MLAWKGSERTRRKWFCSFLLQTGEVFASRSEKKENFKGRMGPPAVSGRLLPQEKKSHREVKLKDFCQNHTQHKDLFPKMWGNKILLLCRWEKKWKRKHFNRPLLVGCRTAGKSSLQKTGKHKTLVSVIYLTFWNMMTSRYWTLKTTCLVISTCLTCCWNFGVLRKKCCSSVIDF